jgi:nucleotide-binding universal stress UspA family protein
MAMKKIIVPTDFSKSSLSALETAITIAANGNALIQILHINDVLPGAEETNPVENASDILEALAENIKIRHGVKVEVILAEGMVGHVIAKYVLENKADLVVMGTYGVSGIRELFIGSNAYYVLKRAGCPVLLIPEGNKENQFNRILFPVQQNCFSSRLFDIVYKTVLVNSTNAVVKIMGVCSLHDVNSMSQFLTKGEAIKNKYSDNKIETSVGVSKNLNIAESVLMKAEQLKANLIIISPGLDNPDLPFFIGPFTQKIINHSKSPILSILRA